MEVAELIRIIVQLVTPYLLIATFNLCGHKKKKIGPMAPKTAPTQMETKGIPEKGKGQKREKESESKADLKSKVEAKGDEGKDSKEKKNSKDEAKPAPKKEEEVKETAKPVDDLKEKPQEPPKVDGQKPTDDEAKAKPKETSKNEDPTQTSVLPERKKGDEQAQTSPTKPEGDARKTKKSADNNEELTQTTLLAKTQGDDAKEAVNEGKKIENQSQEPQAQKSGRAKPKIEKQGGQEGSKPEKDEASEKGGTAVKISHRKFEWDESGGQQVMTVTNNSEITQAIKVKTSDNKLFSVYPVYCNIQPGQSMNITVFRKPAPIKKDKIVTVSTPNKDNESPEKLFKNEGLKLSTTVVEQIAKKATTEPAKETKEKAVKEE